MIYKENQIGVNLPLKKSTLPFKGRVGVGMGEDGAKRNSSRRPAPTRGKHPFALLLALLISLALSGPVLAAPKASGAPPKDAKCPVCGMLVAKYPNWNASLVYRDGSTAYFDGPKDLFSYYLNPRKYDPAKKRTEIVSITVKDYYSLASIDARQAYFAVGSNVLGPMGKELIPFAQKGDADGFLADHQGRKLLRFPEVTPELVKSLE